MTHSYICRKRCRSDCDEESSEFTPLSKRINNLHINNLLTATATVETGCCGGNQLLLDNRNLPGMCPHALGINGGVCSPVIQDQSNQWNGVLVAGQQLTTVPEETGIAISSAQHQFAPQPPNVLLQSQYNPDLSASENPYYYENNRLLFNLYMERLQRVSNCNYVVN